MKQLIKLAIIVVLCVGAYFGYQSLIPPPVEVVSVRMVDAVVGLDGIGRQNGKFVFMGGEQLMLLRDNPEGSHVLVRARVSQKVIREFGRAGGIQDIRFSASDARLWRGGSRTEPVFLIEQLDNLNVDVSYGRKIGADDWGRRLQRAVAGLEKAGKAQVKGTQRFGEGAGAKGADVLRGNTEATAGGFQVRYGFGEGTSATVSWNEGTEGWMASMTLSGPNTMTDFMHTWTVEMLFPRPGAKGKGTFELKLYDQMSVVVDPEKLAPKP